MNRERGRKNVAVIILNYNNWQYTVACAESVLAGSVSPVWVIIVDNASSDDSVLRFQRWAAGGMPFTPPEHGAPASCSKPFCLWQVNEGEFPAAPAAGAVALLRKTANNGYAAGNNAGISLALRWGADAFWILNNDTLVEKKALEAMAGRLFSKARPGLCGALIRYMDGERRVQCRGGGRFCKWTGLSQFDGGGLRLDKALEGSPDDVEKRLNFICGACVMVSRDFIESVGLMDERYFLYCEEQDWAYRADGRFDFAYAADAVVYHKEGASTNFSHDKSCLRAIWHLTRSRLLLTWKNAPYALPTVCLSIAFAAVRMFWRKAVRPHAARVAVGGRQEAQP